MKKCWVDDKSFVAAAKRLLFFEIYKKVFSELGVWHSPNMFPSMIHGKAFRIE
jgi:hypothetical protein